MASVISRLCPPTTRLTRIFYRLWPLSDGLIWKRAIIPTPPKPAGSASTTIRKTGLPVFHWQKFTKKIIKIISCQIWLTRSSIHRSREKKVFSAKSTSCNLDNTLPASTHSACRLVLYKNPSIFFPYRRWKDSLLFIPWRLPVLSDMILLTQLLVNLLIFFDKCCQFCHIS